MRVLITGVTGFVGQHLAAHVAEQAPGCQLFGMLWGECEPDQGQRFERHVRLLEGDLTRGESVRSVVEAAQPEVVIHLAAATSVARSWSNVARALSINAIGTANLLEALLASSLRPLVVVASSAEVYGRVEPSQGPIREEVPLAPVSPYGTSKTAQDLLSAQYAAGHGLHVVRLRPFHLTGPGRPPHFALSGFAERIARIEAGLVEPRLEVGNLDAVRDITDVRDAARAYWLVVTRGVPTGAYNLCSGRAARIGDLLDRLLALTSVRPELVVEPGRLRADDIPWLVGDHARLTSATGWQPIIPLEQTLADLLAWWRARLAGRS